MSQLQDSPLFALRQRHDNYQRFEQQEEVEGATHPYPYSHTPIQTQYFSELSEESTGEDLPNNNLLRKGRWSPSEDARLILSIKRHGANKWKTVAKDVVSRSGDQCWKRWNDSLDPHLTKEDWTPPEDAILEAAVLNTGRLWSKIANNNLPGRSGLSCKNRWDHIQRKQRRIHQSQRDILNGHNRGFLDSNQNNSNQHQTGYISDQQTDLAQSESNRRHSFMGNNFHRHSIDSVEYDTEDDNRSALSSSGGSQMYNSALLQRGFHRNHDQQSSTSWSNSNPATHGNTTTTSIGNNTLPSYVNRPGSFTLTQDKILPPPTNYSSSLPMSTPGNHFSHSTSNTPTKGSSIVDGTTLAQPYRHHLSWFKNQTNTSSEAVTQQSTSLSMSQEGSFPTADISGHSAEVEHSPLATSTYQHRHHLQQYHTTSDESTKSITSFRHHQSSFGYGSGSSFPDFSNSLPVRTGTAFPRNHHSTQSSQAVWGPRGDDFHPPTSSLASSMLTRPLTHKQEESHDTSDRFRWQPIYSNSTTSNEVDRRSWSANTNNSTTSVIRDGFNVETRSVHRSASNHHPFAFSPDGATPTVAEYSYQSDEIHQDDNRKGSFSDSDKSMEGVRLANRSSDGESDSFPPYRGKAPKLEDVSNSVFYDDLRYQSHSRHQQEENYQDEEITSDEEEEENDQINNYPSSSESPIRRPYFALL